ncbi:MAG: hypothetical protein ACON4W_00530 [Parvibaculales bacterium]
MPKSPTLRRLAEPGGVWLIVLGLPEKTVAELVATAHKIHPNSSVTVLIEPQQKNAVAAADDVWVFNRLGPAGLLALLRRASWRHFDQVYQFVDLSGTLHHAWLKWFVWPRPAWLILGADDMSGLDLRAG